MHKSVLAEIGDLFKMVGYKTGNLLFLSVELLNEPLLKRKGTLARYIRKL